MLNTLGRELEHMRLVLPETALFKLGRYFELILEWNERMNLTNITAPHEAAVKHMADSLYPLALGLVPQEGRLIDVGTGAGLPGLPLAIAAPKLNCVLFDSLNKRMEFLRHCVHALALDNVTVIHARAEELGHSPEHRGRYDTAVSRAVARMSVLSEYMLPLVKLHGRAIAYKGPAAQQELAEAQRAITVLGGAEARVLPVNFSTMELEHRLVVIDKAAPTPKQYPRRPDKIKGEPLW